MHAVIALKRANGDFGYGIQNEERVKGNRNELKKIFIPFEKTFHVQPEIKNTKVNEVH